MVDTVEQQFLEREIGNLKFRKHQQQPQQNQQQETKTSQVIEHKLAEIQQHSLNEVLAPPPVQEKTNPSMEKVGNIISMLPVPYP